MSQARNKRRSLKKVMTMLDIDQKILVMLVSRMAADGPAILDALVLGGGTMTGSGYAVDGLMNAAKHMEAAILAGDASRMVTSVVHVLFLARHVAILQGKIVVQAEMAKA